MSPTAPAVQAVTFDFWDTLVRSDDSGTLGARRAKLITLLGGYGHHVEAEVLDGAFVDAFSVYTDHWRANRQFTARDGALHVLSRLEIELDPDEREAAIDAYTTAAADIDMQLTDHVADTLAALHARGIRLGIICDVGMTPSPVLRGWLDRHGVLELFDHWSFSDEVGWYKPAPQIFEHALAGLGGVEPGRAAHVGDLRRTDVAGARAMGMIAVRYRGVNDNADVPAVDDGHPRPEADIVLDDHADLLGALGLV
jgi:putative hydrolase of the HAD superfamily